MSAYGTERGAPTHDGNPGEASELPQPENLGFGRYLGAHLVLAEHDGAQWSAPGLLPREALRVPVASAGVQYGLSVFEGLKACLLYTSPSPRDGLLSRMPSSA